MRVVDSQDYVAAFRDSWTLTCETRMGSSATLRSPKAFMVIVHRAAGLQNLTATLATTLSNPSTRRRHFSADVIDLEHIRSELRRLNAIADQFQAMYGNGKHRIVDDDIGTSATAEGSKNRDRSERDASDCGGQIGDTKRLRGRSWQLNDTITQVASHAVLAGVMSLVFRLQYISEAGT